MIDLAHVILSATTGLGVLGWLLWAWERSDHRDTLRLLDDAQKDSHTVP